MLLAAGLAGAVLNTVLLSAFLLAVGQFNVGDVMQVARPLLIGDTIGIAVVTPLLLRFRVRSGSKHVASFHSPRKVHYISASSA